MITTVPRPEQTSMNEMKNSKYKIKIVSKEMNFEKTLLETQYHYHSNSNNKTLNEFFISEYYFERKQPIELRIIENE